MTQDLGETNRLLTEILSAIQGLDHSLREHDKRIGVLENVCQPKEDLEEPVLEELHQWSSNSRVSSFLTY